MQNEYDKIQDELDLQKENGKGLEGDLSTTLHELHSFKEKFSDMESQLLKANQMIDTLTLANKVYFQTYYFLFPLKYLKIILGN